MNSKQMKEFMKALESIVEEKKETPFARHSYKTYWSINTMNSVVSLHDYNRDFDNAIYDAL